MLTAMDFKSFRWKLIVCILVFCFPLCYGQQCNGIKTSNKCYSMRLSSTNQKEAEAACLRNGLFLASVTSEEEQKAVSDLLGRFDVDEVWLGLSTDDKLWKWIDGRVTAPQGCFYESQSKNSADMDLPNIVTPSIIKLTPEKCIDACEQDNFLYAALRNGTICSCGNSFGRYNTSKECVVRCPGNTATSYSNWCGGKYYNSVYYVHGAPAYFGYHQPNNYHLNQQCGILDTEIEVKMADERCTRTFSYLCDTNRDADDCTGRGYHVVQDRCYFVGDGLVTWFEARESCQGRGGDLAVVASRELRLAIRVLLDDMFPYAKKVWMGMYKGGWFWSGGSALTYDNWADGYPTNNDDNKCVVMTSEDYKWKDVPCGGQEYYICEEDLNSSISNDTSTTSTIDDFTSGGIQGPEGAAASTSDDGGWNALNIALAVLAGILLLMFIVALVVCMKYWSKRKITQVKPSYIKGYDARPIADIPNSGHFTDYDIFSSTIDLRKAEF